MDVRGQSVAGFKDLALAYENREHKASLGTNRRTGGDFWWRKERGLLTFLWINPLRLFDTVKVEREMHF